MNIAHIDHIVLTVRDIEATCEFYQRVLGIMAVTFDENRTALVFGSQKINLHPALDNPVTLAASQAMPGSSDFCLITEKPLGEVIGPVDEKYMPTVPALSGSGPAYLFLLAEAMTDAAEAEGLPAELAARLARLTVEGAAALMAESGETPGALRKAVTSPGGTTQAALDILMDDGGMSRLLRQAIRAAANRDRELSRDIE